MTRRSLLAGFLALPVAVRLRLPAKAPAGALSISGTTSYVFEAAGVIAVGQIVAIGPDGKARPAIAGERLLVVRGSKDGRFCAGDTITVMSASDAAAT